MLAFELELVHVASRFETASSSIRRRFTLRPRFGQGSTVMAPPAVPQQAEAKSKATATDSARAALSNSLDSNGHTTTTPAGTSKSDRSGRQLAIKMKRLRGDSYMYTSLCRTTMDLADVRRVEE